MQTAARRAVRSKYKRDRAASREARVVEENANREWEPKPASRTLATMAVSQGGLDILARCDGQPLNRRDDDDDPDGGPEAERTPAVELRPSRRQVID
uniref:Uncharacterized protein n=1 Tax=Plectus sambesii TaxID=2011161 RepID=A0A914VAQ8_9BILA